MSETKSPDPKNAPPENLPKADDSKEKGTGIHVAPTEETDDLAIVVDDSDACGTVIAGILKRLKVGVHAFRSPQDALKFLEASSDSQIDKILLVFSDLDMPGMDGIEFFSRIRKMPRAKDIPLYFVSGSIEKKHVPRISVLRPDGIVVKPFKSQSVVDKVMEATMRRQRRRND